MYKYIIYHRYVIPEQIKRKLKTWVMHVIIQLRELYHPAYLKKIELIHIKLSYYLLYCTVSNLARGAEIKGVRE